MKLDAADVQVGRERLRAEARRVYREALARFDAGRQQALLWKEVAE